MFLLFLSFLASYSPGGRRYIKAKHIVQAIVELFVNSLFFSSS